MQCIMTTKNLKYITHTEKLESLDLDFRMLFSKKIRKRFLPKKINVV